MNINLFLVDYLRKGYQDLTYCFHYILVFIQDYAWYIVFSGLAFYYIFTKFIRPILESLFGSYEHYKKTKEEQQYSAKYHKDPDLFSQRVSSQQAFAQKLQEQYDQQAKEHQAKLREREALKRQELNRLLESQEVGNRLGGDNSSKPKSFKPEYFPLISPGSSSNYRPAKKSKCGGGGCGK